MLHKFAIKASDKQRKPIQLSHFMESILFIVFSLLPNLTPIFAIDQTIQSMSQMMKSPNKNQKQITKPHQYCRCRISCLPHHCTITHKKLCTKPAHDSYSWPLNGPRICRVLLSSHFVIRWVEQWTFWLLHAHFSLCALFSGVESTQIYGFQSIRSTQRHCFLLYVMEMIIEWISRLNNAKMEFITGHFVGRIMGRAISIECRTVVYAIGSIELPIIFGGRALQRH